MEAKRVKTLKRSGLIHKISQLKNKYKDINTYQKYAIKQINVNAPNGFKEKARQIDIKITAKSVST